ncbi:hypothetical protein [Mesoterricola silvestris]|uniref:hypothetical protein n=1 Tax=Mesoterricola silvestris TaxID=2927979 RepID=UPI0029300247|nr:hypothetical protein [Mesoterricola silvestris]
MTPFNSGKLVKFPFLLGCAGSLLWSQGPLLQVNAGLGNADSKWNMQRRHPNDFREWADVLIGAELGAVFPFSSNQRGRFVLGGTGGTISNYQVGADYQWSLIRNQERDLYVFAGPSLNFISGTYTVRNGFVPPDGSGDYRDVSQRWRPGIKFGVGFQWAKHWAGELDAHLIHMATSGPDAVPEATTGYVSAVVSFRFSAR